MFRSLYQVLSGAGHAATPAIRGTWVAAAMSVHMTVRRCSPLVFHTHVGKSNLCNNFKIISHARSVGKKKIGLFVAALHAAGAPTTLRTL